MSRRDLRSKKVFYLFTFISKECLKQILQKIKKSNIRRSCRNLYLIFFNQKFVENVFSYNATVRPILLVKNMMGHSVLLLFIFPCLHGYTNVNNLPLNMTR